MFAEPAQQANLPAVQAPAARAVAVDETAALCQHAQDGDLEAEAKLIALVMPGIRNLLMRTVWDKDSVEDLLQDTLELAVCKLRTGAIQHPGLFELFARGIARHLLVSHIRKKQRDAGKVPIDKVIERNHLATDGAMEPLQHLLDEESTDTMLTTITRLPRARDRRVLIGHYFLGLSARCLSRELRMKEAHFYRVLYRARKRLEKILPDRRD